VKLPGSNKETRIVKPANEDLHACYVDAIIITVSGYAILHRIKISEIAVQEGGNMKRDANKQKIILVKSVALL